MEEQEVTGKSNKIVPIVVVVLVVAIATGVIGIQAMGRSKDSVTAQLPSSPSTDQPIAPTQGVDSQVAYTDGEYTVTGNYISPGGSEEIGVMLTLEDGVIIDIEVEPRATRPISKEKQADFAANYKSMVVGKNIDEVRLTKVSGSSLTPNGFNDALEKIRSQARS